MCPVLFTISTIALGPTPKPLSGGVGPSLPAPSNFSSSSRAPIEVPVSTSLLRPLLNAAPGDIDEPVRGLPLAEREDVPVAMLGPGGAGGMVALGFVPGVLRFACGVCAPFVVPLQDLV